MHHGGLEFGRAVPQGGYRWWYIDALSDDGEQGLTVIAFVGSVFSPYYAWARRRGPADPENHCAFNVALYGSRHSRWAMTERGARHLLRDRTGLSIGPSSMRCTAEAIEIHVDEICAPLPRRIRGLIRLLPSAWCDETFALDAAGRHRWSPHAPCARVEVRLSHPKQQWQGVGYLDSNSGDEPLEDAFESWNWSRASWPDATVVLYDIRARRGSTRTLALKFEAGGTMQHIAAPAAMDLGATGWGVERHTRADAPTGASVIKTLEDSPFYSRSLLATQLLGQRAAAIHESLSLDRFRSPWVQCLLPFRMPRALR